MKSQKSTESNPGKPLSRRRFLKTAGLGGAALAVGLTTKRGFSNNLPEAASPEAQCGFNELPESFIYLNSGTEGSMPECVMSNLKNNLSKWASNPTVSYELDPELGKRQELNRTKVEQFLGVGKNNVCLTDNTTMGLSMTIMGLNFGPNDKVVTTNHEHPAMISPLQIWQSRQGLHIETQAFPSPEKLNRMSMTGLLDALFPNTPALRGAKALCVSHVYPTTGVRLPLGALRKKADELNIPYLIVDGAQAMGMIDISSRGDSVGNCDFYACPGHKWLNGPPSTGVLYIRNADIRPPEFYPTISQRMIKYADCEDDTQSCFPMAKALQVRGCSNAPGFTAMVRAMKFIEDEGGPAHVEKHILKLSREVKNLILSRAPHCIVSPHSDAALLSGLTAFFPFKWDKPQTPLTTKQTANWVVNQMLEKNIQIRSIGIPNVDSSSHSSGELYALRVSTAYFNTAEQVEFFKHALQDVLKRIS